MCNINFVLYVNTYFFLQYFTTIFFLNPSPSKKDVITSETIDISDGKREKGDMSKGLRKNKKLPKNVSMLI